MLMKFNLILLLLFAFNNTKADSINEYSAKYFYKSDEISIKGIRKLEIRDGKYSLNFKAKNLLASMRIGSEFNINEGVLKTNSYSIRVKPSFVNRDQDIKFDYQGNTIQSTGREEWEEDLDTSGEILDPLNAQIKIRINLISGLGKFSINLLEIESGKVEENFYEVVGKEVFTFNEIDYECIKLKRIRETDDRETIYYIAPDLNFMFLKIVDTGQDRNQTLELIEILSLG
jgi:hypothetical protein